MVVKSSLKVFGLPVHTDDEDLRRMFDVFGSVDVASVCTGNAGTQRSGLVSFHSPDSAMRALAAMKGCNHKGKSIQVTLAGGDKSAEFAVEERRRRNAATKVLFNGRRVKGSFLEWKGQHGWIEADNRIDHPSVSKHFPRIFVDMRDVDGADAHIKAGDRVSFVVYADSEGLGAAEVRLDTVEVSSGSANGNASNTSLTSSAHASSGECASLHGSTNVIVGPVKVNVAGWPPTLEISFKKSFERYGAVVSATVSRSAQPGRRATGSLMFASAIGAQIAIRAMHGKLFGGQPLSVEFADAELGAKLADMAERSKYPTDAGLSFGTKWVTSESDRVSGTLHAWKGRYGLIAPDKHVPQPAALRHRGPYVYVDSKDLEGRSELASGERVSFVVYSDNQGLGAAKVRVERSNDAVATKKANARLDTGVSLNVAVAPPKWWHALPDDCCPLSLMPLEELPHEPFGLRSETVDEGCAACLWGIAGAAATRSSKPVHWYDGKFLACTLVSTGQFFDPLCSRQLTRDECVSLDKYLIANGLPLVHVAEAFDISRTVSSTSASGGSDASACGRVKSERLAALSVAAVAMLKCFDEVGDGLAAAALVALEPSTESGPQSVASPPAAPAISSTSSVATAAVSTSAPAAQDTATTRQHKPRRWGREKS